jgi:hypothetical protein
MNTNPWRTLELLAALIPLGFDDRAFTLIHHMKSVSIADHWHWCKERTDKGTRFHEGSKNTVVQKRLEIVLAAFRGGSFMTPAVENVFCRLAEAAALEIPFNASDDE